MADTSSQESQNKILKEIVEAAKKAFDPSLDPSSREAGLLEYTNVVERSSTWQLLLALNALIKPNVLPQWLVQSFMQTLTHLPLRPDGVRGTMEFVFSVHPSNSGQSTDATNKQGANITHEAVAMVTKLLSSVPSDMTSLSWFEGLSSQLFSLLDGAEGPDLARTAAQILGYGILGRRELGAQGTPGWEVFVKPILDSLNPSQKKGADASLGVSDADEIIDLSNEQVLVESKRVSQSLDRLRLLVVSNASPGLCRRLIGPILTQVWVLAASTTLSGTKTSQKTARELLATYLRVSGHSVDTVNTLMRNLLCQGSSRENDRPWEYRPTPNGIQIAAIRGLEPTNSEVDWSEIEARSATLIDLLVLSCTTEDVSSVFIGLLQNWVTSVQKKDQIEISVQNSSSNSSDPMQELIEVATLQKMLEKAPEKLVGQFDRLLEVICQVLEADSRSPLGDDLLSVVLSLLNLIVTAPTFRKSDIDAKSLSIVEASLDRLSAGDRDQVVQTAANLSMLIKYRDELDEEESSNPGPTTRQIQDRKTYNLAMNYVTAADNPPPVVSEGLDLLSGLITTESTALDITAVTVLMSNMLKNNEDYINLRVIKIFTLLANNHPRSTLTEIIDQYLDSQEKANTDTRLRFGEAMVQVIERLGDTFMGEVAQRTCETLLSVAGRRGYRPKTLARQQKEEKIRKLKKQKESEIGEDILEDEEELTEEQAEANDIMAQIVQGWDSKRGSEDVRMRASSLSILGKAIEVSIGGIGSAIVSSTVDLCINILTLEPELEKSILRRSAILAVLSFVRALDRAKEASRNLGFGLTDQSREDIARTLQYIAGTDKDGLVRQHANDVFESLENWQMASMLPQQTASDESGLGRLAGLHVEPAGNLLSGASDKPRPRIEEIE